MLIQDILFFSNNKTFAQNLLHNIILFYFLAHEQLGLILLGSCPGGAASNFWTAMFDGDVNLSVTMTMVSSIASFGMTSLWAWLLGRHLVNSEGSKDPTKSIEIPYHMIATSLLAFAIPPFCKAVSKLIAMICGFF